MRRVLSLVLLFGSASCVCAASTSALQQRASNQPTDPAVEDSVTRDTQPGQAAKQNSSQPSEEKPGSMQRLKQHLKDQMSSGCIEGIHCWDKSQKKDSAGTESGQNRPASEEPLPRSDEQGPGEQSGESSSRNTKIDLSPPPGEAPAPGVGDVGEVQEMKPWDPHKADKNNEVGDYYYRLKNYKAAESRYSEALYWQDNNAHAMFGIAQTEEKLGRYAEARRDYQKYLNILPGGDFAPRARQGLERLKDKPDQPIQRAMRKPAR